VRLQAKRASLVVVDVQSRLVPAIDEGARVVARCGVLIEAARLLDIPVAFTEHNSRGIGATVSELTERAPQAPRFQKLAFAATREPDFAAHMDAAREGGRDQVLLCGMEAHVCLMQTTLGLVDRGFEVAVAADAVGARSLQSVALALERLRREGATIVNAEMALFEWAERADIPAFRALLALIK
jgi:nicotinamidase-related amidase